MKDEELRDMQTICYQQGVFEKSLPQIEINLLNIGWTDGLAQ